MSDVVKCQGCGSTNTLPDGKDSMQCIYCGNGLERKIIPSEQRKDGSLIKVKPEIINGDLVLNNRKIKSIAELIVWFSDSEINTIKYLDLSNNEISSLKGLDTFQNLNRIDLDYNKVNVSDEDVKVFNNLQMSGNTRLNISLMFNTFGSLNWIEKINFDNILNTYHEVTIGDQHYEYVEVSLEAGNGDLFFSKKYLHPKSSKRNSTIKTKTAKPISKNKVFGIAGFIIVIFLFYVIKNIKGESKGAQPVEDNTTINQSSAEPTQQISTQQLESKAKENAVEKEVAETTPLNKTVTAISNKAYFYDEPNTQSIRKSYIVSGQIVDYTEEQNGFIKATFTNSKGSKTEGWMSKADFVESKEEIKRNPEPKKDFANVFWDRRYTLFDLITDEPIFPINKNGNSVYQIYYTTNENPQPFFGEFTVDELEQLKKYKFANKENCLKFCESKTN